MLNVIRKYQKELTAEELGTLVKMSFAVINGEDVAESDVRIVNYLFKVILLLTFKFLHSEVVYDKQIKMLHPFEELEFLAV